MSAATTGAPPITDAAATRSYFEDLYGSADGGYLPIWTWPNKRTEWFAVDALDAAAAACCRLAEQRLDVYHGMGLHPVPLDAWHRGEEAGVLALPGLYMDLDIHDPAAHTETALPRTLEDVLSLVGKFPLPPTLLIHSGHGVYAHWLFREAMTIDGGSERARVKHALMRLQSEMQRLGRERGWKFDSTADLARVLRPPGVGNWKTSPVLTRILHEGGDRYILEEIEDTLPDDEPPEAEVRSDNDHRPALAPILEECPFLAHCRDDAATLPEPEWHSMMTVVSLCEDGESHAHQLSRDHPKYSQRETQKKYERSQGADKPIRCETVEDRHGDDWCVGCQHRGAIKSPIQLGYARVGDRPGHNGKTPQADAGEHEWPQLDPAALHGLAGDVVRAIEPHTEGDPAALLINFLTMFGSAVGPSPFAAVGATRHRGNLYAVHVGKTARSRKGTANSEVKRVVMLADEKWAGCVTGGLSSGEGLIYAVRDPLWKPDAKGEMKLADPGVDDKRLLVVEEEFSSALRVAGRDGNTLSEVVRRGWDGGDLRTLTRNSPLTATAPHIGILGHITRDELLRELSETNQVNGFANRFLFACVRRSKLLPDGGAMPDTEVNALAERVQGALQGARYRSAVRRDAEASAVWREVYPALTAERLGMLGAITARAEAQVLRLSLIYALLDGAREITRLHLEAALAVWQYCEDSARYIFGDATGDPVADQILTALRTNGRMTQTQISELFGRNQKAGRLERALAMLLNAGKVRTGQEEKSEKGGRRAIWWEAV